MPFGLMRDTMSTMLRTASAFVPGGTHESSRSFEVNESPADAQRIVERMRIEDASTMGALPPGVSARRNEDGFDAVTPFAAVDARFSVRSNGRGGSIVTEHTTSHSPMPGGALMADAVHAVATSAREAYFAARSGKK